MWNWTRRWCAWPSRSGSTTCASAWKRPPPGATRPPSADAPVATGRWAVPDRSTQTGDPAARKGEPWAGKPRARHRPDWKNVAADPDTQAAGTGPAAVTHKAGVSARQVDHVELRHRIHVGVVVHVLALEAEQLQEVVLVAGVVGDLEQVLRGHGRPHVAAGLLHVVAQLAVVHAQPVGIVVGRRVGRVQV